MTFKIYERWRYAILLLVYEVTKLSLVGGYCSVEESRLLSRPRGFITYNSSGVFDDCTWTLPTQNNTEVLLIKVDHINMTHPEKIGDMLYEACSGILSIPEEPRLCRLQWPSCMFYKTISSLCDVEEALAKAGTPFNCSTWSFRGISGKPPKTFSVYTYGEYHSFNARNYSKSFSLRYEYIRCEVDEWKSDHNPTTVTRPAKVAPGHTKQSHSDDTSMITGLAILGSLLVGSWILFCCFCRNFTLVRKRPDDSAGGESSKGPESRVVVFSEIYGSHSNEDDEYHGNDVNDEECVNLYATVS